MHPWVHFTPCFSYEYLRMLHRVLGEKAGNCLKSVSFCNYTFNHHRTKQGTVRWSNEKYHLYPKFTFLSVEPTENCKKPVFKLEFPLYHSQDIFDFTGVRQRIMSGPGLSFTRSDETSWQFTKIVI